MSKVTFTAPEVAERYGVNLTKVGEWIRAGELRAINVATSLRGNRPRYRITAEALAEFEHTRSVVPPPAPAPRRKRQVGVTQYF